MFDPINGGVRGAEPGESEDDVFSPTTHDVEEMFLGDPFDVGVEGASIADCAGFVRRLVHVADGDRGCEFLGGELVFSDKLPVYARDICYDSPLFFSFLRLTFLFVQLLIPLTSSAC